MSIYSVRCKSTKCYLIESKEGLLLFDAGWPDEYKDLRDNLKAQGLSMKNIKTFIVSHFHIDHAGLAGMLIQNGVKFIVFENQLNHIAEMENLIQIKNYRYVSIDKKSLIVMRLDESRDWLKTIGIDGEVIQMHGHGDQSVTLLLDTGEAFIGDIPVIYDYDNLVMDDWNKLRERKAKIIYPAHAEKFVIDFTTISGF